MFAWNLACVACLCVWLGQSVLAAPKPDNADSNHIHEEAPDFVPLEAAQAPPTTPKSKSSKDRPLEDAQFWRNVALKQLERTIKLSQASHNQGYKRKAKNIIFFVGDGMGPSSITMGRIYKGQTRDHAPGEEEKLAFDDFLCTGMAKTYNVNKQVPDSAGTATAMFCGVKTDYGAIGVDVTRSKTNASQGRLQSIMDWAQAAGKRTGIVTTTRITHATPAATYARIYNRDWECDTEVPAEAQNSHADIARQLVENSPGNNFNVIMGGGLSPMGAHDMNELKSVQFKGSTETVCSRGDGRNLAQEWLAAANGSEERAFVRSVDELLQVDYKKIDRLMGLFRNNHITYSIAREKGEPSLAQMTTAAIEVLQRKDSEGFVLMVEGGRIDQAHHQNYARAACQEVVELHDAVEAALEYTNPEETLIIVTADHSHAVTLNGYPERGNDILGFANESDDPIVYETISYANGPGYWAHLINNTNTNTANNDSSNVWLPLQAMSVEERRSPTYMHMALAPRDSETHGGEDVGVYAHGAGADLVRGVFEQNYLAYVVSYAGCIGPAKDFDDTCQMGGSNSISFGGQSSGSRTVATNLSICSMSILFIAYMKHLLHP